MAPLPSGLEKHRFDIELGDLQTFLAVAELESFSRAAAHLNLSQPSISNRIRRIEEKLGVRLLDRTTRRVELTPPGQRLYHQATQTLHGLRALLQEFNNEALSKQRQVKVVATLMVATLGLPPLLRLFHDAFPSTTMTLHDTTPAEAVDMVLDQRCDLAVMARPEPRPGISFEPLLSDPCVAVTPLAHSLLRHRAAPFAEVLEHAILSPNGHVGLRQAIMAEADRRGLKVQLSPEARGVGNVMTLIAMAAAGFGVCIHPRSFVPAELEPTVGVVPFADCEIIRVFGIVTREGQRLSSAASDFRDFLRATVRSRAQGSPWKPAAPIGAKLSGPA